VLCHENFSYAGIVQSVQRLWYGLNDRSSVPGRGSEGKKVKVKLSLCFIFN
jgi:hypothetical protein